MQEEFPCLVRAWVVDARTEYLFHGGTSWSAMCKPSAPAEKEAYGVAKATPTLLRQGTAVSTHTAEAGHFSRAAVSRGPLLFPRDPR